ncbi:hypothetical protein GCM10009777_16460 [Microbacterium pumilum]|uniref:Uncharacterized protein n=1 Tax=Microbacterium pumilum TaxID=344165 RepID=A0ABN2SAR9_9MICO
MGYREFRSTRVCPECGREVKTHDELALGRHQTKKGRDCVGSGLSVSGLPYGPKNGPSFVVDPTVGISRHMRAECDICGAQIAVKTLTGERYPHLDPIIQSKCRGSGRKMPGHDRGTLIRPKSTCPDCGRLVGVGARYGRYYSHNDPETGKVCGMSGKPGGGILVDRIEVLPPPDKPSEPYRSIDSTRDTQSVRTVSGGLPGSRRRH